MRYFYMYCIKYFWEPWILGKLNCKIFFDVIETKYDLQTEKIFKMRENVFFLNFLKKYKNFKFWPHFVEHK